MQSEEVFQEALRFTMKWETPRYTNDKDDPGGATKRGVTQATLNRYLRKRGSPSFPVKDLDETTAQRIYREDFWFISGAHLQPTPELAIAVFDFAVNSDTGRAKSHLN